MSTIETYSFPLRGASYSPFLQTKADALSQFLPKGLVQDPSVKIKISGHQVEIGEKFFWFDPDTKRVFCQPRFKANGKVVGAVLSDKESKTIRSAVKAISDHASDLGLMKKEESVLQACGNLICTATSGVRALIGRSCKLISPEISKPEPISCAQQRANKIDILAQKVLTILFPLSDIIGVIRNLIDLVLVIGTLTVFSPWFQETVLIAGQEVLKAALVLGQWIAGFRIIQGCISLVVGIAKLHLALKAIERCEKNHDAVGLEIAKAQRNGAVVSILTGLFWVSLGVLMLTCPQAMVVGTAVAIVFTVAQWILFYGLFTADSVNSLKIVNKTMQVIDKHYLYFFKEILNNKHLSLKQMNDATKRFLQRISEVSEKDKAKAIEKLNNKLGHKPLPSEIERRIANKRDKKRADVDRTLGLNLTTIGEILKSSAPVDQVLKSFETTIAQQDAQRLLAIICLAVNILGIQCDFPVIAHLLKIDSVGIMKSICSILPLGMGEGAWGVTNDFGWINVNGFYLGEDIPTLSWVTRLLQKIGPKPHRETRWWAQTHDIKAINSKSI